MDAPTSTSARSDWFTVNLCSTYNCGVGNGKLRCMLLDTALPSELVIASHLFRRSNEFLSGKLMGFSDIDDVKKRSAAVQASRSCVRPPPDQLHLRQEHDAYHLKIFDRSLRRLRLFGKLDKKKRSILLQGQTLPRNWKRRGQRFAPGTAYDLQTTFGDVEGHVISFRSLERPHKRCLNLQARLARLTALEKKWIKPEEDEFEDFWSEGMSLAEKMEFYYARQTEQR